MSFELKKMKIVFFVNFLEAEKTKSCRAVKSFYLKQCFLKSFMFSSGITSCRNLAYGIFSSLDRI